MRAAAVALRSPGARLFVGYPPSARQMLGARSNVARSAMPCSMASQSITPLTLHDLVSARTMHAAVKIANCLKLKELETIGSK